METTSTMLEYLSQVQVTKGSLSVARRADFERRKYSRRVLKTLVFRIGVVRGALSLHLESLQMKNFKVASQRI
jgi:hypothetical protein